ADPPRAAEAGRAHRRGAAGAGRRRRATALSPRDVGRALLVAVIWGLAFVATKLGLEALSAPQLAAARFLVAAVPAVVLTRPPVPWRALVAVGLTLFHRTVSLPVLRNGQGHAAGSRGDRGPDAGDLHDRPGRARARGADVAGDRRGPLSRRRGHRARLRDLGRSAAALPGGDGDAVRPAGAVRGRLRLVARVRRALRRAAPDRHGAGAARPRGDRAAVAARP